MAVFSLIIIFRKKMVPPDEREPFSKTVPKRLPKRAVFKKRLETVPFHQKWHHFGSLGELYSNKKGWKRCPWGTKIVPPCKREPFPTFFWKTGKGPVLRTAKRCPKGAVLVPLIFLSVVLSPNGKCFVDT